MFSLLKMLRSSEWRRWPRWKKVLGIAIVVLVALTIMFNPDMIVFAGVFDVSILDILITFLGIQLLLYSDQIKAFATMAYGTASRRLANARNRRRGK